MKSRFLHTSPAEFQLFESILLEDGQYFLLTRHLERLRDSAAYFGFVFRDDEIDLALHRIAVENISGSFKVRLMLWQDGHVQTEISTIARCTKNVALATTPVDSSDRFLFHKTTHRPAGDDLIFWNERGEITESSIANIVVAIDGELFTPPVSSGLLAGTFREQLLAERKIKERVISVEEFKSAKEIYLINSVRRWMPVNFPRKDAKAQS